MNKHIPRIVPWLDWNEWLEVMNAFFPLTDSKIKNQVDDDLCISALDVVSMWRKRGKISIAVDATAQLVNLVRFVDRDIRSNLSNNDDELLRSQYSFIIIRSVNGLVDQLQTQYYADSIFNIASKILIPGNSFFISFKVNHTNYVNVSYWICKDG